MHQEGIAISRPRVGHWDLIATVVPIGVYLVRAGRMEVCPMTTLAVAWAELVHPTSPCAGCDLFYFVFLS